MQLFQDIYFNSNEGVIIVTLTVMLNMGANP